jgi:hypothetical protein
VIASTNPAIGRSWKLTSLEPSSLNGVNGLTGVSCASTSFCAAVDDQGNVFTSTDPIRGTWTRTAVDGSLLGKDVSCTAPSLCVAVDWDGNGISSTNPAAPGARWSVTNIAGGASLTAVSCPSTTLCVTVGSDGQAVVGSSPPTIAQTAAVLRSQLRPIPRTPSISTILKHHGYTSSFGVLVAGQLTIQWYAVPNHSNLKPDLIGSGSASFAGANTRSIKITLTNSGVSALQHRRRLTVIAEGRFKVAGSRDVRASARFSLTS